MKKIDLYGVLAVIIALAALACVILGGCQPTSMDDVRDNSGENVATK